MILKREFESEFLENAKTGVFSTLVANTGNVGALHRTRSSTAGSAGFG